MEFKAKEIAEILDGVVDGNPEAKVTAFARIESGKPGTICFFANPKYEHYVYECKADIIIVNKTFEPKHPVSATMIRVENSYSAVAALLDYVVAKKRSYRRYRGLRSRIRWSAKLGKKVYVGDFAYIGRRAVIGDYTKIYEQVYIGDDVKIGSYCTIYPGMVIGDNVIIHANAVVGTDGFGYAPREDGTWKKIEHTGNVVIEDNVEIGSFVGIDKSQMGSTVVRKGCKIDNHCQIAHNVEVGQNTVMAAMCGIAGSTKIGEHCIFGGQVGVAGHLTVPDNTTFGAQSGLISNIKKPGQSYFGTPAIPYMEYMRSYAAFKRAGKE